MDRYIIGIDPGLKGGVAILNLTKHTLFAANTPVYESDTKTKYDIHAMKDLLDIPSQAVVMTYLEQVSARPGQGVTSMFRFGEGYGIWQGVIITRGFPLTLVTPQKWKRQYGLHEDKEASRQKASDLFPLCTAFWKRKKDDGVAEATLLSHYGSVIANQPVANVGPVGGVEKRTILLS